MQTLLLLATVLLCTAPKVAAQEGARFTNAFVGNSICGPSRAAILTSTHAHVNGITGNGDPWDSTSASFAVSISFNASANAAGSRSVGFSFSHGSRSPRATSPSSLKNRRCAVSFRFVPRLMRFRFGVRVESKKVA